MTRSAGRRGAPRRSRRFRGFRAVALLVLFWLSLPWLVPLPDRLKASDATVVTFQDGRMAHVALSGDQKWRLPTSLERVDPYYIHLLLAVEDKRFFSHPGVDLLAVARALLSNLTAGRVVSGASTLTMQLARLLEPRPRTLSSKVKEALRAVQLELRLSKEEILRNYLRFVPYGRNIEGVAAAAWAYFGHPANLLTEEEIVILLAVPQSPTRRYPSPRNAVALDRARRSIAHRLGMYDAAQRSVPTRLRPFPRRVPHAAAWLGQRGRGGGKEIIPTTLDRGTQRLVERLLARHRADARTRGVHNCAVMVVEHGTARVRALAGGFDWHDSEHAGQIPGFSAPRSTGSLLKPFILALAIKGGLALPGYLVRDLPTRFGGFSPRNFDGRHAGLVRLDQALSRSLNLPFIQLLDELGVGPLMEHLHRAGLAGQEGKISRRMGLSMASGGVEASLLEVVGAYVTLARGGQHRPLRLLRGDAPPRARQLLEPSSVWLVQQALSRRGRPGQLERAALDEGRTRRVSWKTGTSNGHRDAWAVGWSARYLVGVWMGNLDATPSPHLVGAGMAGPLLFDLMEALGETSHPPPPPPADLARLEVCAYSGYAPGPGCQHRVSVQVPARFRPRETCPFHINLMVDTSTGMAVTPACTQGKKAEERSFLIWPADLRRWWKQRRSLPPLPPRFAPGCRPRTGQQAGPSIQSPPAGRTLTVDSLDGARVPLLASSPGCSRLGWYVDGRFLGKALPEEGLYYVFKPGEHVVMVIDGAGQSQIRRFTVSLGR